MAAGSTQAAGLCGNSHAAADLEDEVAGDEAQVHLGGGHHARPLRSGEGKRGLGWVRAGHGRQVHTEVSGGCDTGGWRTQPMPCVLRAAIGIALRPAKKRRPCLVHNGDDNWDDDEEDLQHSTEEEGRASAMGDKDKPKNAASACPGQPLSA